MNRASFRRQAEMLLAECDIRINGDRPWDLHVHNPDLYGRLLAKGSMGLGESYMDGWWDTNDLNGFLYRLLMARLDERVHSWAETAGFIKAWFWNLQKSSRAFRVGQYHYDMGNDLYKHMLGKRLVYSCGYWREADNLDDAQVAKMDLVCRKLGLEQGQRVLDIGCGWGEMAKYAAETYGVEVVGVTISKQQALYARELCKDLPVNILLKDYRELNEKFDHILSVGMFEHVGVKNYATYMQVARRCLKDDGLFLLHCIGGNKSVNHADPWVAKYIFPNGMVPSARQITNAIESIFIFEDWHNFGADYSRTLTAWHNNYEAHWDELRTTRDERFYRMWRFYLSGTAASFQARRNQLWQIVLSPRGMPNGYQRVS
jgi:cyclopropane-fatty-acyl-phospholipid synthase